MRIRCVINEDNKNNLGLDNADYYDIDIQTISGDLRFSIIHGYGMMFVL